MQLSDDQLKQLADDYESTVINIRGHFLHRAIELEWYIDTFIGSHFSDNLEKLEESITLILAPRVTFEYKRQILQVLIERHHQDFHDAKSFFLKLDEIIKNRNILAHYPVSNSNETLLNYKNKLEIRLLKFKNSKDNEEKKTMLTNIVTYDKTTIDRLLDNIYDLSEQLRLLLYGTYTPPL